MVALDCFPYVRIFIFPDMKLWIAWVHLHHTLHQTSRVKSRTAGRGQWVWVGYGGYGRIGPPVYVAWRADTTTLCQSRLYSPRVRDKNLATDICLWKVESFIWLVGLFVVSTNTTFQGFFQSFFCSGLVRALQLLNESYGAVYFTIGKCSKQPLYKKKKVLIPECFFLKEFRMQ